MFPTDVITIIYDFAPAKYPICQLNRSVYRYHRRNRRKVTSAALIADLNGPQTTVKNPKILCYYKLPTIQLFIEAAIAGYIKTVRLLFSLVSYNAKVTALRYSGNHTDVQCFIIQRHPRLAHIALSSTHNISTAKFALKFYKQYTPQKRVTLYKAFEQNRSIVLMQFLVDNCRVCRGSIQNLLEMMTYADDIDCLRVLLSQIKTLYVVQCGGNHRSPVVVRELLRHGTAISISRYAAMLASPPNDTYMIKV